VGHEVDITLLDLVADQRAATPSEAAEMAVPEREFLLEELEGSRHVLAKTLRWQLGEEREKISDLLSRLRARDPRVSLKRGIEVLALAKKVFASWPERSVERARMEIDDSFNSLVSGLELVYKQSKERFLELTVRLDALSPLASLSRGYAVVRETKTNTIIKEASEAPSGSEIDVTLARGHLLCDVKESSDS
jgi:exodeoxyribonuclease VII large subunit